MRTGLVAAAFVLAACAPAPLRRERPRVLTGIDVLEADGFRELQGKRVGLVTNATGRDRLGRSTAAVLAAAPGVRLVSLFTPERALDAVNDAEQISSASVTLADRAIPVHTLFGGGLMAPRPELDPGEALDALVYDIQDSGARFDPLLATMAMSLEQAAKAGIEFVVLDRPNPLGGEVMEGPVLDDLSLRRLFPTAYLPVPIRHGLTIGELALLHNAEVKNPGLRVVAMRHWRRGMLYDATGLPWTPPSPDLPDLDSAVLQPGVGLLEAYGLSVGRGTPGPLRWIGAPWLDAQAVLARLEPELLEGVEFQAKDYTPAAGRWAGVRCRGIRLIVSDRERLRPTRVFLELSEIVRAQHSDELEVDWDKLRALIGTADYQLDLQQAAGPEKLRELFDSGPERFAESRKPYLLY